MSDQFEGAAIHQLETEPGQATEIEVLSQAGGHWRRFVEVRDPERPAWGGPGMTFLLNGVELSAADFPRTLEGWTAFSIAFAGATYCRDKAAALEVLNHEAKGLIQRARSGQFPGGGS